MMPLFLEEALLVEMVEIGSIGEDRLCLSNSHGTRGLGKRLLLEPIHILLAEVGINRGRILVRPGSQFRIGLGVLEGTGCLLAELVRLFLGGMNT